MSNSLLSSSENPVRSAPVARDACGMAVAANLLGDRWTLLILRETFYGVSRFDDLRADLDIPRGILSARLKALVTAGLLAKSPYRQGRERVRFSYQLTAKGQDLALTLIALMQWGERHLREGPSPVRVADRRTGASLTIALVTPQGHAVAAQDVEFIVLPQS
ncbi:putative HTH-type transcriptional regulator [Candidatus Phycosocius bacilliformis]|uniref:Putative HTH-type transcriptional regulator n=1 Tax=Candidatus Phycosocius bacilliformis TaxID=1445552 RepID=A0A2P2EE30_9PROT|nr:helix-turn-helix domain-containing protein [Candidatus Phycosocius bacilliformis]GBF59318.1 putative HTH-type transcriptional regulator [Candidatus Phycosocius bacilliformis]